LHPLPYTHPSSLCSRAIDLIVARVSALLKKDINSSDEDSGDFAVPPSQVWLLLGYVLRSLSSSRFPTRLNASQLLKSLVASSPSLLSSLTSLGGALEMAAEGCIPKLEEFAGSFDRIVNDGERMFLTGEDGDDESDDGDDEFDEDGEGERWLIFFTYSCR